MRSQNNVQVKNFELARQIGEHIIVGKAFAFVKPELFTNSPLSWLGRLMGRKAASHVSIIPLLQAGTIELAGTEISKTFASLELTSITSDKSLYKSDEDAVDLLLLNPFARNSTVNVLVLCNASRYSNHKVELGEHGQAKLTLLDLPSGEYEVLFEGSTDKTKHCKFSVAQYKLVPLVAELKTKSMQSGGRLEMKVGLTSFGANVSGPVSIELFEGGMRQESLRADAVEGILSFAVSLEGEGPHSLNFQLLNEPTKTASLPIIGSRASERSQTLFNPLGTEIYGSLLPAEGAVELRGLYLTEGGLASTPLRLELDDNKKAKLITASPISALKVLVLNPGFPRTRADAQEISKARHPEHYDSEYKAAVALFQRETFEESLRLFVSARKNQNNPHPYYAYFAACCAAKLGRKEEALEFLRLSIVDGWRDFSHMQEDHDLEALHGDSRFDELKQGPYIEHSFEDLPAQHEIPLSDEYPLTVLALAAVLKDHVWEGWTSFVSSPQISTEIESSKEYKSGHSTEIKIKVNGINGKSAAVYVLIKDARLMSQDKPEARLAACIKEHVEYTAKELRLHFPTETVADSLRHSGIVPEVSAADAWGAPSGGRALYDEPMSASRFAAARSPSPAASPSLRLQQTSFGSTRDWESPVTGSAAPSSIKSLAKDSVSKDDTAAVAVMKGHEPEVIFADFVPLVDGLATLVVPLPMQESDYVVECFAVSKFDWCTQEARFRAVSDPLAEFSLPRFVNDGETAVSWLHVGSRSQQIKCSVYRDEEPIELQFNQKTFGTDDLLPSQIVNLKFLAGPGMYRALIRDKSGKVISEIAQTVDLPGKLKCRVRTIHLLREGETFDLKSDASTTAIRVLPGLKESFNLLTEATADYGHACCEQTAAKILSACAMFVFAGDDRKLREKAESIIIAGIRREESMWLKNRGFKTYPERDDTPDTHYGPQAAQHLANLALLDSVKNSISSDLRSALEKGRIMTEDTLSAYKIQFPSKQFQSMRDAYNTCRFSSNGASADALQFVRSKTGNPEIFLKQQEHNPNWGYAVNTRIEASYAAAALFRQRNSSDLGSALALANHVVKSFNEQGRLYSTIDSVAAIALFVEMLEAKLLGSAAKAEINGVLKNIDEAVSVCQEIESVTCVDGVLAIEIERIKEEDWSAFDGQVPLRVALEKNGQPQRAFKLGDQVNLRVKLEQGYKEGDLLWLCLPDCLSRVYGGGQIKLFSVDFAGKDELLIPLAVTNSTESEAGQKAQQKLALCVRNMFEEERGGNPGLIPISAS